MSGQYNYIVVVLSKVNQLSHIKFRFFKLMSKNSDSSVLEERDSSSNMDEVSFLLKIGHELKTPIHGIGGITKFLNSNWESLDDKTRRECIVKISEASDSLNDLLDSLLNRTDGKNTIELSLKKSNLIEVTKLATSECRNFYVQEKDIKISFKTSLDEFFITFDQLWYQRLLINLICNAINYSDKGEIVVEVAKRAIDGEDKCIISVKDEGFGIPESELKSIFEPFNRSSRKTELKKGIGLGLAICREIVDAHKGTIRAVNNEGAGATIEIILSI
ncbi:MAG: hypothetical protein COA94_00120 [Rickettsiales bacterium]|nr:MAG: hypothetical protein COA94_00120 [Rickettsiales bacterium]